MHPRGGARQAPAPREQRQRQQPHQQQERWRREEDEDEDEEDEGEEEEEDDDDDDDAEEERESSMIDQSEEGDELEERPYSAGQRRTRQPASKRRPVGRAPRSLASPPNSGGRASASTLSLGVGEVD